MIKPSSLAYLTRRGWKSMVTNRMMTVASIGILTACLFITGVAVLLGINVNNFAGYLAGQNEVVVYLYDSVEQQQAAGDEAGAVVDTTAPTESAPVESTPVESTPAEDANADLQETAPEEPATYTVQSGDTPSGIANDYDLTTAELYALNPGLEDGGLYPGDVLVVSQPTAPEETPPAVAEENTESAATDTEIGTAPMEEPDVSAATPIDIDAAVAVIESIDNIASYTYVSKDDALTEAIGWMGEYSSLLEEYRTDNPMPASFRITVKNLEQLPETVSALQAINGVEYINSPNEMARILITVRKAVLWVAVGLVAILGLVCIVVIGNTIRLTVMARFKEINIMKYVGATNGFIRWPFFVEGMTVGFIAGLLAFGLLSLGYTQLIVYITGHADNFAWLSNMFYSLLPYASFRWQMLAVFVGVGMLLGGIGTAGSVHKYLKV